jgi:succinate-semialdehyde dehydrogenase/glutarate-semialdehyde dehydrogenase
MIVSIDPTTGVERERFAYQSRREIDTALSAAWAAQAVWRQTPILDRVNLLRSMAKVLRAGRGAYSELITLEMGKPIVEAEAEIDKCAWNCEFYAEAAPGMLAPELIETNATHSAVVFDPLGVVLAVMPWNYPFWQFFRFAAPAFAAGNAVILKHANNVPQCALAVEGVVRAAARQAGAPADLCRTLMIAAAEVADLIDDDRIAAVTLTGSTEVGRIVAARAGRALKKQVLELGGSDPFVVLDDADIEVAAATAVKARFTNAGQSCINAKRFIVAESVAEEFVAAFVAGVGKLKVGNPLDRTTDVGAMARANLRLELHRQVELTVAAGATLKAGGHCIDGTGFFYAPTVLDHVTPDMVAFREETFGPVAAIVRVKDVDEAIVRANQTDFGLGAALWTRDVERARALAGRMDAGAVFINGLVASDPRLPFGGIKHSGYGRELGSYGLKEFVNIKSVWIGPARQEQLHVKPKDGGDSRS